MTDPSTGKEFSITDYDPLARTLYVTPNYLEIQNVPVSPEGKDYLNHLQAGEFGLLLPEKLKGREEEMIKRYEDYLSPRDDQGKYHLIDESTGDLYSNHQKKRFIYNNTPIRYKQFFTDPVLVVIQPESFGGYVNPYFTHLNPYLYFNGLQNSKKLIAEYNLEKVLVSTTMQWTFTSKWPKHTNRKSHGDCRRSLWYSNLCSSFLTL